MKASLQIWKYNQDLSKSGGDGGSEDSGIFFQVGVAAPNSKTFLPVRMMMDSGLTGKTPLALTEATAKRLNLSPTQDSAPAQLGDGRMENMNIAKVDIEILGTYVRGVPAIIGSVPTDIFGFGLMELLNLYVKAGEIVHVELNQDALKGKLAGPA